MDIIDKLQAKGTGTNDETEGLIAKDIFGNYNSDAFKSYEESTLKDPIKFRWLKRKSGYEGSRTATTLQMYSNYTENWVDIPTVTE